MTINLDSKYLKLHYLKDLFKRSSKFIGIISLTAVSLCDTASAQLLTDEEEQMTASQSQSNQRVRPYSVTLSTSAVSSFHRFDSIDKTFGSDYGITGVYSFDGFSVIASTSGFQDYRGERKWYWGDASLGLYRGLGTMGRINVSGTLTGIIPMSENNKDYRRMYTGLIAAPLFSLRMDRYGVAGLTLSYRPSASMYFHQHEVALNGSSNTRYSFGQRLRASYAITERIYFGLSASYARSFTYAGNSRDSYGFLSSLGFQLGQKTSLEMGHSTQGNPLKANGIDNELVFFNLRDSIAFVSLAIRI